MVNVKIVSAFVLGFLISYIIFNLLSAESKNTPLGNFFVIDCKLYREDGTFNYELTYEIDLEKKKVIESSFSEKFQIIGQTTFNNVTISPSKVAFRTKSTKVANAYAYASYLLSREDLTMKLREVSLGSEYRSEGVCKPTVTKNMF